ncbi:gas vesicle protein GvpG [Lamprobacter modestohalophilus]|uniref:gas vesicle protein GvpG n=1 Tax=Lamprobacter modestohalophilus TaxID=1064514 RepID=UPI002ADEE990|nr:gas vesicle protein GvpG [Lamprobacter modestohalophilus]MEA1050661.1 gas vesicle protein GvpG [Lamprobacter modestohalophilus]
MLLIDDLLLSPYRGLLWIFKEIHNAALEEVEGEAARIRNELTDLYMMLETEQIDEEEFDRREGPLLDRLDELEADEAPDEDDADEDDADDEDLDDTDADAVNEVSEANDEDSEDNEADSEDGEDDWEGRE